MEEAIEPEGAGEQPRDPALVNIAGNEFAWPVPDRTIPFSDRPVPVELAGVSAAFGVVGLLLLGPTFHLFRQLPDLLKGIPTGNEILYARAWPSTVVALFFLLMVVMFFRAAGVLWRSDPAGRGLAAMLFALTSVLEILSGPRSGALFFAMLVTGLSTGVLYISPWVGRTYANAAHPEGRPSSVVLFDSLALPFWALGSLVTVISLPTLTWFAQIGGGAVILTLTLGIATFLGLVTWRALRHGPDPQARAMLTLAVPVLLVGTLIAGMGAIFWFTLVVLAAMVGPLWLTRSAQEWFREAPDPDETGSGWTS